MLAEQECNSLTLLVALVTKRINMNLQKSVSEAINDRMETFHKSIASDRPELHVR